MIYINICEALIVWICASLTFNLLTIFVDVAVKITTLLEWQWQKRWMLLKNWWIQTKICTCPFESACLRKPGHTQKFHRICPKITPKFLHDHFSPQKKHVGKTHWMKQTCTKVFPTGLLDCTVGGMTPLPRPVWMIHKKKRLKLGSFCWPWNWLGPQCQKLIGISQCWC